MKVVLLKIAQIVPEYLGYFGKNICYQEVQKIAQSGHTARTLSFPKSRLNLILLDKISWQCVCMAQIAEQSLPKPEICGSKIVINVLYK